MAGEDGQVLQAQVQQRPNGEQSTSKVKIPPFDPKKGVDWATYEMQLEFIFESNGLEETRERKMHLVASCGIETFALLTTLLHPKTPKETPYADIMTVLGGHFRPEKSVFLSRFDFRRRFQKQGETVSE